MTEADDTHGAMAPPAQFRESVGGFPISETVEDHYVNRARAIQLDLPRNQLCAVAGHGEQ